MPSEYSALVVDLSVIMRSQKVLRPSNLLQNTSVIIKMKEGAACSTFNEFASVVYNHIIYLGNGFQRIDVIVDRYFEDSLKGQARKNRGSGSRVIFTGSSRLPSNFGTDFLRNDKNKEDLNLYLAHQFLQLHTNCEKTIVVTFNDTVLYQTS